MRGSGSVAWAGALATDCCPKAVAFELTGQKSVAR